MLGLVRRIPLRAFRDARGALTVMDHESLPFTPIRGFCTFDVPAGKERGGHAHRVTEQAVIALNGSFEIELTDGRDKVAFRLASREEALYIPPLIWDRLFAFSSDAVCLVLASTTYQPSDYIRDWKDFLAARADLERGTGAR